MLGFDLIVGLTTFERIAGANFDDLRALHGMARIRHGYLQAAPLLLPYFITATHDDIDTVSARLQRAGRHGLATIVYGLSTSLGMVGLIVSMLGGVEIGVIALAARSRHGRWPSGSAVVGAVAHLRAALSWGSALRIRTRARRGSRRASRRAAAASASAPEETAS